MRQADLEKEMVELGKQRYWASVSRGREKATETYSPAAKRLLGESITQLDDEIQAWMQNSESGPGRQHRALAYLSLVPTNVTAALTARTVLDGISQKRTLTSIAVRLGQYLEDDYRARKLKTEHPGLYRDLFERTKKNASYNSKRRLWYKTAKANDIFLPKWNGKDRCAVGFVLIELMRLATGLIEIETVTNIFSRSVTLVRATKELLHWLKEAHAFHEILTPVYMPMVVDPLDWKNMWQGGYLSDEARRRPLVKTYDKAYLEELDNTAMPEFYSAINALQRTKWEINDDVLQCMLYCYENNSGVGNLPANSDRDIPTRPSDEDWVDEVIQKQWRRSAREVHMLNQQDRSKRLQLTKVLYLAQKFAGQVIRYPKQCDFRGRIYDIPAYLNPQGPDWARSVLRFAEGDPIKTQNDANYLGVHLANCWGLDKKTIEERLEWVWSNEDLFKAVHQDPLGTASEWSKADEPWGFLAAAMDMGEFLQVGFGHVSKIPVAQDASNQGHQIYAMLLRDPVGAKYTNVLPSERPHDLYQQVADLVIEKLKVSDDPRAAIWLKFGIDRKTVKRQVMVSVYGGTQQSCKEYTAEWYFELVRDGKKPKVFKDHPFKACIFLSNLIYEAIGEAVQSAQAGMDWLRGVTGICMEHGVSPMWSTPTGYLVKQLYEKQESLVVQTSIGQKIRRHRLKFGRGEISPLRHKNAVCPNLIHSFDATLLMKTTNLSVLNGVTQFSMIHDSCATTAAKSGMLASCLRQATVDLFTEDLMENFAQQITHLLPHGVSLPPIPYVGGLEIESVFDSQYYFS
jgi:DNA-directed RNA polymerase